MDESGESVSVRRRDTVPPARVLYVLSDGRSGSTVVAGALGNIEGFVPVGELRGIWQASRVNELCGCGQPFGECPFWQEVGQQAFGGWEAKTVARMLLIDKYLCRHRSLPRLLFSNSERMRCAKGTHSEALSRLYAAIQSVSGGCVIVDSSKDAPYALALAGVGTVRLRVVHLIRDSRGVVYSWGKRYVHRPEYERIGRLRDLPMGNRGTLSAAAGWAARNSFAALMPLRDIPLLRVRYEDVVEAPGSELSRVASFARERPIAPNDLPLCFLSGEFESKPYHSIGGNPVRFRRGTIRMRPDLEWRDSLSRSRKVVVTLLTFPWLVRYRRTRSRRLVDA